MICDVQLPERLSFAKVELGFVEQMAVIPKGFAMEVSKPPVLFARLLMVQPRFNSMTHPISG